MREDHDLNMRRVDRAFRHSCSAQYWMAKTSDDSLLIAAIESHTSDNSRRGFGLLLNQALRPEGLGKAGSWRVYSALKLNFPRRGQRRLPARASQPLVAPESANNTW
jgi:putative transposase